MAKILRIFIVGLSLFYCEISVASLDNILSFRAKSTDYCETEIEQTPTLQFKTIRFKQIFQLDAEGNSISSFGGALWLNGGLVMSHIHSAVDRQANPSDLVALYDKKFTVLWSGYGSNRLTYDNQGFVVASRQKDGSITNIIQSKKVASGYSGKRFNSPGGVVYSRKGDLYFSDSDRLAPRRRVQNRDRLYHRYPNGRMKVFGSNVKKPNELMLLDDQKLLYVGGMNGLFRFNIRYDGGVIDRPTKILPNAITGAVDGMTKDCAGNLFITAGGKLFIASGIDHRLLAIHKIKGVVDVTFGGDEHKDIYITTLGTQPQIWVASSNIPGYPF